MSDLSKNELFWEYGKIGMLHIVLVVFLLADVTPYLLWATAIYVVMLIFTLGNGRQTQANSDHFLNIIRTTNQWVIRILALILILLMMVFLMSVNSQSNLLDIGAFLLPKLVVLILSFMCPFLSGCTILSMSRKRKRK